MTGFVSGRAIGANHDPEPYVSNAPDFDRGSAEDLEEWQPRHGVTYAPRPEYDVPVNPILDAFRQEWNRADIRRDLVLDGWIADLDEDFGYAVMNAYGWTPEQISHARRVLAKLAALTPTTEGTA
jgi:hypothetical protein